MKTELTSRQMSILVMLWTGIPALTALPFAAQKGIINIILGGLLVTVEAFVICQTNLNGAVAKPVLYTAALSLVMTSAANTAFITKTVELYILPNTDPLIVSAVFTAVVLYMAVLGTKTLGRTAEILFAVCLLNVAGAVLSGIQNTKFISGSVNISDILKASCAFGGVQLLYFVLPRTKGENTERKAVVSVAAAVTAVILFLMISMGKFGTADMSERRFAIYNIMDSVNIPAVFGDKHDLFMLRIGIFGSFTAVGMGIIFAGNTFTDKKYFKCLTAVLIFIISIFAEKELLWFTGIISIIIFGIIVPFVSWRGGK